LLVLAGVFLISVYARNYSARNERPVPVSLSITRRCNLARMPYVRVVVQEMPPEQVAAVREYSGTVLEPALAGASGLRHWVAAGNMATGGAVTISIWDTQQQAEAGVGAVVPDMAARVDEWSMTAMSYVGEIVASASPNPPGASFVRVLIQSTTPGQEADLDNYVKSTLMPALATAPGLHAACIGSVEGGTTDVACSLWDTQEQAEAGVATVLPDVLNRMASLGVNNAARLIYQVVAEVGGVPVL
jgi:hypothetical protein